MPIIPVMGTSSGLFPAQTGIVASPVTYNVDGEQYVTILAGWGGVFPLLAGEAALKSGKVSNNSRILTFKLGGKDKLPDWKYIEPDLPEPLVGTGNEKQVAAGNALFHRFCSSCHGDKAVSAGVLPDLRYSYALQDETWFDITVGGILKDNGMVSFSDQLTNEQLEAIRQYIIVRAHFLKKAKDKNEK
ncbi:MAG: c-type cytochrome [Emcibacter sp.]|nr:c-type cytochrome [Emcibacter sp.]